MPVNLKLEIENDAANQNGFVGYDAKKIYENLSSDIERNSERVKPLYSDTYPEITEEIARSFYLGRNELAYHSDKLSGEITANLIQRSTATVNGDTARQEILDEELKVLNMINDDTPDDLGSTPSNVYNPDFPTNSISFNYDSDISGASERGADDDGVMSGSGTPNLKYPITENAVEPHQPVIKNAGFGIRATTNSLNIGSLHSINILKKYI